MSFESGRKLGLTASLIAVIMPVVGAVAYGIFIFSLIASIATGFLNPSTPSLSFYPVIIIVAFAAIGAISFAGLILFIVAMHRLAQYYSEPGIFKNALYGFIINIIGAISLIIIYIALIGSLISTIPQGSTQTAAAAPMQTVPPTPSPVPAFVGQFIVSLLAVLAIGIVLGIISALFYMRAFNRLAEKSRVDNFKTAGLLYLIGQALTIVGVGVILIWVAWIFAAMGFHSLKPTPTITAYSMPQPSPSPIAQKKNCPYCGSENNANAIYCSTCGRKLQ